MADQNQAPAADHLVSLPMLSRELGRSYDEIMDMINSRAIPKPTNYRLRDWGPPSPVWRRSELDAHARARAGAREPAVPVEYVTLAQVCSELGRKRHDVEELVRAGGLPRPITVISRSDGNRMQPAFSRADLDRFYQPPGAGRALKWLTKKAAAVLAR